MRRPYARLTVVADAPLPTRWGTMRLLVFRYRSLADHVAMTVGDVRGHEVPVHLHTECRASEVFGSLECDCRARLDAALASIASEGRGVVVYLRPDGGSRLATASALLARLGVQSLQASHHFLKGTLTRLAL